MSAMPAAQVHQLTRGESPLHSLHRHSPERIPSRSPTYSDSFEEDEDYLPQRLRTNQKAAPQRRGAPRRGGVARGAVRSGAGQGRSGAAQGRISPRQLDEMTRSLLGANRVKIQDLKSENENLRRQISQLTTELKTIQRQNKLQEKQIDKLQGKEAEMPDLVTRYTAELSALNEHLKRERDRTQELTSRNQELEARAERARRQLVKLKSLTEDRQLEEREVLARKSSTLEARLEAEEKRAADLEKHLEILTKNHRHEVSIEIHRNKDLKRAIKDLERRLIDTEQALKEKTKLLEMQHIYSQRLVRAPPHRLSDGGGSGDDLPESAGSQGRSAASSGRKPGKGRPPRHSGQATRNGLVQEERIANHRQNSEEHRTAKRYSSSSHNIMTTPGAESSDGARSLKQEKERLRTELELEKQKLREELEKEDDERKAKEEEEERRRDEEMKMHTEELEALEKERQQSEVRLAELSALAEKQRYMDEEERKRKDALLAKLKSLDKTPTPGTASKTKTKDVKPMKEKPALHAQRTGDLPWESHGNDSLFMTQKQGSNEGDTSSADLNLSDDESETNPTGLSPDHLVHQGHAGLMAKHGSAGMRKPSHVAQNFAGSAGDDDDDIDDIEELQV